MRLVLYGLCVFAALVVVLAFSGPAHATHPSCHAGRSAHSARSGHEIVFVPDGIGNPVAVGVVTNRVFLPAFPGYHVGANPSVTVIATDGRTRFGHLGGVGFARRGRDVTIIQRRGARVFVFP